MKCKNCMDCSYITFDRKIRGGGGTYECSHPNAQDNWGQSPRLCHINRDGEFSLKRVPRWCPLSGYKINMGYEKLLIAAYPFNFEPIKCSEFLEDREKSIILAHYQDGKTYTRIANEMSLSKERVRKIASSAMDKVRLSIYNYSNSVKLPEEFYDLSLRCRNALIHNDLRSEEEILKYINGQDLKPEEALMQLKNIGSKSAKEICDFLQKRGPEL